MHTHTCLCVCVCVCVRVCVCVCVRVSYEATLLHLQTRVAHSYTKTPAPLEIPFAPAARSDARFPSALISLLPTWGISNYSFLPHFFVHHIYLRFWLSGDMCMHVHVYAYMHVYT